MRLIWRPEPKDLVRARDGKFGNVHSRTGTVTPLLTLDQTWRMVVSFDVGDVRAVEVKGEPYHDAERGPHWVEVEA